MGVWLSYIGLYGYSYFHSLITNFDATIPEGGIEFMTCHSVGIETCKNAWVCL